MKKNILKIIIITLLFIPSISQAQEPDVYLYTGGAENITETSVKLKSTVAIYPPGCSSLTGYSSITGEPCEKIIPKPFTAYYRYSKLTIPPIFCNDIYGSNMISTEDIFLGTDLGSQSFSQNITNLTPDTDYYYCAIISNKDNIIYGSGETVKKFHTNPLKTRITTKPATRVTSTSATLNGSFSSVKTVKTYFKYREDIIVKNVSYSNPIKEWITKNIINVAQAQDAFPAWKIVGEKNHVKNANNTNLNGNINFLLTGLKPSTRYIFMAETDDAEAVHVPGTSLSFTTTSSSGNEGGVIVVGNCYDNIKNGNETGVDTGGRCWSNNNWGGYWNPFPQVNVTASDTSILPGETSTIYWTSSNATSCDTFGYNDAVQQGSTGSTSGSFITGKLTNSKSFSVKCTGLGGTASGNVYIYVNKGNETTCPVNWTGVYPTCIAPNYVGICPVGWTGTYPKCTAPVGGTWTWDSKDDGSSGTWTNGTGSGTWTATTGIGGIGIVNWTGNGAGTWVSGTGSGTWTSGGIINTTPLTLGQITTPPSNAIVRYHEGIETVFTRQIMADIVFAKMYGYVDGADLQTFAEDLSHLFAKTFGYIDANGKEIRVSLPDIAAYQLQFIGNKLTVYEYYNNKIVDIRNVTTVFKKASGYEYYFKK